jgi:hypothetical protein
VFRSTTPCHVSSREPFAVADEDRVPPLIEAHHQIGVGSRYTELAVAPARLGELRTAAAHLSLEGELRKPRRELRPQLWEVRWPTCRGELPQQGAPPAMHGSAVKGAEKVMTTKEECEKDWRWNV